MEAGNKLLSPPSAPELLARLGRIEKYLTRVEQSPSESKVDIRVAVASFISKKRRITAPDAPHNNDQ